MSELPLLERARKYGERVAIVDALGAYKYSDLLKESERVAEALGTDIAGQRVAYLVAPDFGHVAIQWGIWRAGAIGVPLNAAQAPVEWAYVVDDSRAVVAIVDDEHADRLRSVVPRGVRLLRTSEARTANDAAPQPLPPVSPNHRALILYTSGTTGKPKGVVLTHANIEAQVQCLRAAWEWCADDRILLVLPLHHVHGIVNVLTCALSSGATCEMPGRFDADAVWNMIATRRLTLFMAVPTIYTRLIRAWERANEPGRAAMSAGCRAMRLMVSGSAALPVSVLERWREISGHVLLERYGMTEIGMALSNPLRGERRPGSVGVTLPGASVRIVDEQGREVEPGTAGELEVKGASVFREYWQRPDATAAAFHDGWFRTGDVAVLERGMYRLLGRQSVDIIKSGGYKISALEIEEVLRDHPAISECAVVGIDDPEWGERVAVAAVPRANATLELDALREWARDRLARYKLPTRLAVVRDLPRNAMGKVLKPETRKLFTRGNER